MVILLGDPQSEELFLGSLLLQDQGERSQALSLVDVRDFSQPRNAAIYEAIALCHGRGAVTPDLVARSALAAGTEIGIEFIDSLVASTPFNDPYEERAARMRDLSVRRTLAACARNIDRLAKDSETPISDVVAGAERLLLGATTGHIGQVQVPLLAEVAMEKAIGLEEQLQAEAIEGLCSSLPSLDNLLRGFKPRRQYGHQGRPSMGKSAWCLWLAWQFAQAGAVVLYVHLEMENHEGASRLASSIARVPYADIDAAYLDQQEQEAVFSALSQISSSEAANRFVTVDEPGLSWEEIRSIALATRARMGRLDAVFVDHLHIVRYNAANEGNELGRITAESKAFAKQAGLSFHWVMQLNRGVEGRANKRPTLADAFGSDRVGQNLDGCLSCYREEYYDPDTPDRGIFELIVSKNRGGPTGTARLLYEPQYNDFRDVSLSPSPRFTLPPPQEIRLGVAR